jgi:hypothetical protein
MHLFDLYPFTSCDGFKCNLWRLQTNKKTPKGPVLLVHGAGVSSNIFNAPNEKNLLDALSEDGYDVWLENWRGSTLCANNEWNLDIVANYDHPAAVKEVCRHTGYSTIKAIIHCQGSTSFMISAVRGLLPQVTTIVSNAVSLHPVVSFASRVKINTLVPVVKPITNYLNPHWGDDAPNFKAKLFRSLVNLTHWENDTTVGKFVSFTYGVGHPALWELDNLTNTTKNWIRGEFGYVPMSFFDHITKCIAAGTLVSSDGEINYGITKPKTSARFAFFAGKLNKCFKSESQVNTYNYFDSLNPGYHKLYIYDTYSHLDIFMGKNAYTDIFPAMIYELNY